MDRYALITGASSGIGSAFAKLLAKDGYNLILVARREAKLHSLKDSLSMFNRDIVVIPKDLTETHSAQDLYNEIKKQRLNIEVLVNNAGFGQYGAFSETDLSSEENMIMLNITAVTGLMKLVLKDMLNKNSGKILNVASTAAFQPGPLMAVYYATKAYVLMLSEAVAKEVEDHNITVTALCPGPTDSEFQSLSNMDQSNLVHNKKLPSSEEVAEFGYRALKKGRRVAIHGFRNKLLAFLVRILPRNTVLNIVNSVQKPVSK